MPSELEKIWAITKRTTVHDNYKFSYQMPLQPNKRKKDVEVERIAESLGKITSTQNLSSLMSKFCSIFMIKIVSQI